MLRNWLYLFTEFSEAVIVRPDVWLCLFAGAGFYLGAVIF